MSKPFQTYPGPSLDQYCSDAMSLFAINSPMVQGASLQFLEAGVKNIIRTVLLPLWNSYDFFNQQTALLKKVENLDFVYDPSLEATNENVMDKWILASLHSLLRFVNAELEEYRFETVVPKLLEFIDNTTHWYIKLNRRRLKGQFGVKDTQHALNTLFEVLYTMCRGLGHFAPCMTDNIYQRLSPFIPASYAAKHPRIFNFWSFPEVREELPDEVIERRVTRMQAVIDMGRVSRDRCTISLKTPLKSLVIVHPDQEYLEDVRSLEGYIRDELNVRDTIYSSDKDKYDVQYSCSVDWPSLGKKLKKDAVKVKKALPEVSTPEIKEFLKTGEITVAGIALTRDDLLVKRSLREGDASKLQEVNTDNDVLIILDVAMYPELEKDGLAREIINRVQRLRKKAGLVPTDDVGVEYRVLDDPDKIGLEEVFETQSAVIEKALRRPVDKQIVEGVEGKEIIMEEDQKVRKATFLLRLVKL